MQEAIQTCLQSVQSLYPKVTEAELEYLKSGLSVMVKAIALKGLDDYVPTAPQIESVMVEGGHISPLEAPKDVLRYIKSILN